MLFANELLAVKGELAVHESAILSCLHLLSYSQARGQILSLRPDASRPDLFFERRLDIYLQCLIHARRASPEVCSEDEGSAAEDCLGVMQGRAKDFPSILRLLEAVGNGTCEAVLPLELIKKALRVSRYQENLTHELNALKSARRWFDAYKLVFSLRNVVGLPAADQMLRDMFPDYPMWAAWRPDSKRIMSWESPNLAPYRNRLFPVLDLEGPDATRQQRGTLRMSSPGVFDKLNSPTERHLLDRLLDALDASLGVGPATVNLLIILCLERDEISERTLGELEAAIQVNNESSANTLASLVRALSPEIDLLTRMAAFSSALYVLTANSALRLPFGISLDICHRASAAFLAGQEFFSLCLSEHRDIEPVGFVVLELGHALLAAEWLHSQMTPSFIQVLEALPTKNDVSISFRALKNQGGPSAGVAGHVGFLATHLGGANTFAAPEMVAELTGSVLLVQNLDIKMPTEISFQELPGSQSGEAAELQA